MEEGLLVQVQAVGKKYCRSLKRSLWYGVKDIAKELASKKDAIKTVPTGPCEQAIHLRDGEFWAVQDASFELRRGECIGLIGKNGAGKTTLLKVLNGLIKPDHGRVVMRGRVGGVISLGAGFSPILTGRENIYINGAILGMSRKEIDRKIEAIIDFAGLKEFIDSPVKSYSSGMQVRLGFAVATSFQPDVLLLDEVLAVGDAAFRNQCYQRIGEIKKNAAVIFVSHAMEQVSRICDRVIVMSKGRVVSNGSTESGIDAYERLNLSEHNRGDSFISLQPPITLLEATLNERVDWAKPLLIRLIVESGAMLEDYQLRIYFYGADGRIAGDSCIHSNDAKIPLQRGKQHWKVEIDPLMLKNGPYDLSINLIDQKGNLIAWSYKQYRIIVSGAFKGALGDCHLRINNWKTIEQG